jgi:hypothetical protein
MNEWSSIVMLLSAALFLGGVVPIAWERAPAWRAASHAQFRVDFAHTLRRMDRLQPALLLICLVSTTGFAATASGTARTLAALAAGCFLAILVGSGAALVPTQSRLIAQDDLSTAALEQLKKRWLRGHLIRTIVALVAFVLLAFAAVV